MKLLVNIAVALGVFVAGYFAARTLSASPPPSVGAGEASAPPAEAPSALAGPKAARGHQPGSEAVIAAMADVEAAVARGDFESLLGGEWDGASLDAWADADPAALWEYMQAGGWEAHGGLFGLERKLFTNWFRRDPDAAIAALEETHSSARRDGRWAMFGLLFDDDPEVVRAVGERLDQFAATCRPQPGEHGSRHWRGGLEVVERMMGLPDSNTKGMLVEVAVGGWAERDWRAVRDWAASLPQPQRAAMERAIFNGAEAWSQIHSPEGIAWTKEWLAREENRDMRSKWGGKLVEVVARKDPAAALDWAGENLGGKPLAEAVGTIVEKQFSEDREGAIALVDGLPPGGVRQRAGSELIIAMAPEEPWEAFDRAIGDLGEGNEIDRGAWGEIGEQLAKADPDGVWEVFDGLPDEVPWFFQERIYLSLPDDQAERTLERAAGIAGGYGDWIYSHAWRQLNKIDPAAAAKWEKTKPKP